MKNNKVCESLVIAACDFTSWSPNMTMMSFVSNGDGGQTDVGTGESITLKNAHFQGALFGTRKVMIDTSSRVDGPMIGSEVVLGQAVTTDDFPTITAVPAGMPGAPTVYAQPNPPQMFSG